MRDVPRLGQVEIGSSSRASSRRSCGSNHKHTGFRNQYARGDERYPLSVDADSEQHYHAYAQWLNQIASVNSTSTSYNTKASMTNDGGGNNYGYNDNNWLTTASG